MESSPRDHIDDLWAILEFKYGNADANPNLVCFNDIIKSELEIPLN